MIIVFEGHSDDIVAFAVGKSIAKLKRDETDVDRHGRRGFVVATPGQTRGIAVVATYGVVGGTWTFAYGQLAEGRQLPRWAFTTEIARDYSTRLVIDTIDDLVDVLPQRKEDD